MTLRLCLIAILTVGLDTCGPPVLPLMTFGTCHPYYAGGPIPSSLFSERDSSSLRLRKRDSAPSIPPFLEGRCDDATCRFTHVAARTFASIPIESLSGSLNMWIAPSYLAPRYSGEQGIPEVALSATSHKSSTAHFPSYGFPVRSQKLTQHEPLVSSEDPEDNRAFPAFAIRAS